MNVPLSWIRDYIDLNLSLEDIARLLTMAGLEVGEVRCVGLPVPPSDRVQEFKFTGLSWDPDKIVVAQIDEVLPHPNADRLVLCRLNDGQNEYVVLTGAPNLYPYKGQGLLEKPIKVAYAKEGSRLYDGHQAGQVLTTLKRAKIRGVDSFSMVCSEKELGISEEHEGVIFLDEDAPTGMALVEYMGDAVFEIDILPNMIRNASVEGVARELAAVTGLKMHKPQRKLVPTGPSVIGQVDIQITEPKLNPRFVLGLARGVTPQPSPYWVQRRLRLAGMRPINSIVDSTNYEMLETGEPLHAFDYDVLVQRAGGKTPTIITRAASQGEKLTTLDGVERTLDDFTVLVCDTAGALSLAGVMGGMESEVTETTRNVLLEGASWNFVNARRTTLAQKLSSEAGYRFSRGVHPGLAPGAVQMCLDRMVCWSGGEIAKDLVDDYPQVAVDPVIPISPASVKRLLGIELSPEEIVRLLSGLEFECRIENGAVLVKTPPIRLDIGEGVIGEADLLEEIARLYGYNKIPAARLSKELPPQRGNPALENEERVRDLLVSMGMQEIMSYRMTTPEREARLRQDGALDPALPYVRLANPITAERNVMRRSLLASVMDAVEHNSRLSSRLAFYEISPVFWPVEGQMLPEEPLKLAIVMTGDRLTPSWDLHENVAMDFFDIKGVVEALMEGLHIPMPGYVPADDPVFHPGKCAEISVADHVLGVFGELHPLVKAHYDFGQAPVLAASLDMTELLNLIPRVFDVAPVPAYPPVLEDIAVVVDEAIPAEKVASLIRQTGGKLVREVRLFDVFRGERIGAGKKSLAYSLTYQAPDRTLTDGESAQVRNRIVRRLEQELGAKLRS
jgi:phenylalanyl-tRNA synthetase beta chain